MNGFSKTELAEIVDEVINKNQKILAMEARLVAHDHKFETHDKKFDAIDKRFDAIDKRFDAIDKRFDAVDKRFEAVDKRLDSVEFESHRSRILLEDLDRKFDLMLEIISPTVKKVEKLEGIESRLDDHSVRIEVLEHSFRKSAKSKKVHDKAPE